MSVQQQAIDEAFHTLYYGGQDESKRAAFGQRWGGFSEENFAQALVSGTVEEQTLAILALAQSKDAHIGDLLQARQRYGDLFTQIQINETLKAEIAQVLAQRFGLPANEQAEWIERYADAYFG
ncbi:MAG TPA: hypothetical protein VFV38_20685 [Ktedonobacteraceae bacterium]|nr:hypothetical protein [Ktedonobacteraceae bacterium]